MIVLTFWTKPIWEEPLREIIPDTVHRTFQSATDFITEKINDGFDFDIGKDQISALYSSITNSEQEHEQIDSPQLSVPKEQAFSIGNIELGHTKTDVEREYGEPKRQSENEYGIRWTTYHENYQNFMVVAYDGDDVVRGLFTNQDLISSQFNLALGDTKATVGEILEEPEEVIRSGWFNYRINSEGEYDIYKINGSYVTIFYDMHEGETITALQIIDGKLQDGKDEIYAPSSHALKEGFEYQLFDITNATRINHGLSILTWDEDVRETARKHSTDMAENQFFGHTNLEGQSPFDRMAEDGISFTTAGENLAYGQFSSIFAHQGLMNSLGHRENILHDGFTKLGIGVAFDENNQPFYTEKFFSN